MNGLINSYCICSNRWSSKPAGYHSLNLFLFHPCRIIADMNGLINSYCISSVCTQTMDAGNWCGSQCSKKRNDALSAPSNGPRFFSGSMPLAAPRRSARTDESTSTWRRAAARFPGEVSVSPAGHGLEAGRAAKA